MHRGNSELKKVSKYFRSTASNRVSPADHSCDFSFSTVYHEDFMATGWTAGNMRFKKLVRRTITRWIP